MAAVSNVEFSLSPASLNVSANIQVKEGNSTTGFAGHASGPSSTPGLTNQLIQRDQPFNVQFDWTETGGFVPFLAGGTWHIDLLFEAMGGTESAFNPNTTETSLGVSGQSYSTSINIAPFTLTSGLYRIVARMQWHFATGNPGPLVMFSDMGLIQIYQDS